jgi:hypothetical protein
MTALDKEPDKFKISARLIGVVYCALIIGMFPIYVNS